MSLTTSPIFSAASARPAYSPFDALRLVHARSRPRCVVCASWILISAIEADSCSAEPATSETLAEASSDSRNAPSACCVVSCDEAISAFAVDFIALVLVLTMPSISSMRVAERGDRAFGQQPAVFLRQHGFALILQPLPLGDVFVRRDPAAALHRLPGDADRGGRRQARRSGSKSSRTTSFPRRRASCRPRRRLVSPLRMPFVTRCPMIASCVAPTFNNSGGRRYRLA